MSSIHGTVLLFIGLALVGCERNPGATITAPTATPADKSLNVGEVAASNTDAMQSVTGHYQFVGINTGNDFKYSFSAIRHNDGSVSGEFEERVLFASTGEFIRQTHGTVTCFQIVGNAARIGGVVDQATDPRFLPGTEFRLVVEDNGTGASDPPDRGSNARFGFPGTAEAFCNAGTAFNIEDIQHGNIEVRP
jgi:hypothetical protein